MEIPGEEGLQEWAVSPKFPQRPGPGLGHCTFPVLQRAVGSRTHPSLPPQPDCGGNSLRCPDRCLGHRNMAITCHGQGENSHARRLPWTREMGRGGPRGSEVPLRSLAAFPCCPLQRSLRAECLGPWSSEQSTPVVSRKSPFTYRTSQALLIQEEASLMGNWLDFSSAKGQF